MSTWNDTIFQNANSPIIEQLIFFHDHSIILLTFVTISILYFLINICLNKNLRRLILEGQEIEIIWTIFPTFLLIFIAIPSLRILYIIEESFIPSLTTKVIAHQWYWSYEYTNFGISFDSFIIPQSETTLSTFRLLDVDNRMIIPFNINSRIILSSSDVLHAWTIPSLRVKIDAVPGRLNQILFSAKRPGVFFGQCSEICGANHSFIPICIEVISTEKFKSWIKSF